MASSNRGPGRPAAPSVLEPLEDRRLLSGNVTVIRQAATNTVVITGDGKSNEIVVTGSLAAGTYTISGAGGTTVNRQPGATLPLSGSNGSNFRVSLGGGDDAILFGSASPAYVPFTANAVSVSTANGNDRVNVANASVRGGLKITTANGNDAVDINFSDVFKGLSVQTGNGNDSITFGPTLNQGVNVSDGATVNAGRHADSFTGSAWLRVLTGARRLLGIESNV